MDRVLRSESDHAARDAQIAALDRALGGDWWHEIALAQGEDWVHEILAGFATRVVRAAGGFGFITADVADSLTSQPIADGAGSRLAQQLAGSRTCRSTGLVGVAGRTLLSGLSERTRRILRNDPMLAFGPGGVGLFASWHAPGAGSGPPQAPAVIWGLLTVAEHAPAGTGDELAGATTYLPQRRRWAPALVDLPRRAVPDSVGSFPLLAAEADAIAPWAPRRVTALGDAAHVMPPTGGQGSATAILDAHHLATLLAEVARGDRDSAQALQAAAVEMRARSATAVRASLRPVTWIKASAHPTGAAATALALPVGAALAAVARGVRVAAR